MMLCSSPVSSGSQVFAHDMVRSFAFTMLPEEVPETCEYMLQDEHGGPAFPSLTLGIFAFFLKQGSLKDTFCNRLKHVAFSTKIELETTMFKLQCSGESLARSVPTRGTKKRPIQKRCPKFHRSSWGVKAWFVLHVAINTIVSPLFSC